MPAVRVHGGVITDQTLSGSLRFFKLTGPAGAFTYTTAPNDTTVIIPGADTFGGNPGTVVEFYVGADKPVPGSAAERAVKVLIEKATLVQLAVASATELHLVFENTSFGWDDAAEMQTALQTSGPAGDGVHGLGDPGSNDPPVPDATNTGTSVTFAAATVAEVPFVLA